jgi:hypothetical protein
MKLTSTDILEDITYGRLDADLAAIKQALDFRMEDLKETAARQMKRSITVGDTLYFTQTANPTYLRGLAVTVKKINPKKLVVTINDKTKAGRFMGSVTCPLNILSKTP